MKSALLCLALLATLASAQTTAPDSGAPWHSVMNQLRPGQPWTIRNNGDIRFFKVEATFPVRIDEAGCEWNQVTRADFHCKDSGDITITDQRPIFLVLGRPNSVKLRYQSWTVEPQ